MEISKEELLAFIETMSKNTILLEKIANTNRETADTLKSVKDRVDRDLAKDISVIVSNEVTQQCNALSNDNKDILTICKEIKTGQVEANKNIEYAKWFIAIIAVAVIVASVIIRTMKG